ncbi:chromate efflux transporter [Salinicola sp. DM10]|uniref:chromate efflux transporter n=1 Tax=Salinicola sp. DM10 TaxID=2815721 RepID=UPI001A8CBD09|nr:chromate efflux transporter [Salinicola sp. DM10]MCE3028120.1 chromate efflux transporter [Salinicola sp. DM10]
MSTVTASRFGELFRTFLWLGLTAFGGPVAHLGYFREAFVLRRRWLNEADFADLVALCQFLPGPASSQVGFAIGLRRGGLRGALVAWCAFTLPSAVALVLFAAGASALGGETGQALIHGLKLVAVAVVAHAVWGMARKLCPDLTRATIALIALCLALLLGGAAGQLGAILVGAGIGLWRCRPVPVPAGVRLVNVSRRWSLPALVAFVMLLLLLPLMAAAGSAPALAVMAAFYRSGALVFGGGHVVLPLLQAAVVEPGWVSQSSFVTGYGAAQAVPGPLFTFAAYLGAAMAPGVHGWLLAALATLMIFLPGMLLLIGVLPHWERLRASARAQRLIQGANAAVVGILAAALYDPVWQSAILAPLDIVLAALGFGLLTRWHWPAWRVVLLLVAAAMGVGLLG